MSFHVPEIYRVRSGPMGSDSSYGNNGAFLVPRITRNLEAYCIASDGLGWEHVSCHIVGQARTPTWEEMCAVKDLFWADDDVVIQIHPKKSQYVNNHPDVLHLWRQIGAVQPTPPIECV